MNLIEKINKSIGLTNNDLKIITFLLLALIIGSAIKLYKSSFAEKEKVFDYSIADSIFNNRSLKSYPETVTISDSQKEYFRTEKSKKNLPEPKSININTANKSELMRLPGVGPTIASRIIEYRKNIKKFETYDDLLNVKGIGKKKLAEIKKYIIFK